VIRTLCIALALFTAGAASAKPPSWDTQIDGAKRFKVLKSFEQAAVLDRETGLVWPTQPLLSGTTWVTARQTCETLEIGSRYGWRLPRIEELTSLLTVGYTLPEGHPFSGLDAPAPIWSATAPSVLAGAQIGFARTLVVGSGVATTDKTLAGLVFCVRGGTGSDLP
jgi:hypothetical protein